MHSSISSSSDRVPVGKWAGVWSIAFIVCASVILGWDHYVRTRGLNETAVDDTVELWIRHRERASLLGDNAVILVGASRMQMGLDLQVMQQFTTGTPVQLAISAAPFMPMLAHLADDDTITGRVIVSFTALGLHARSPEPRSTSWLVAYDEYKTGRTAVFYQPVETGLKSAIDFALVSFRNNARPQQLLFGRSTRNYVRTLPDRSQQADYSQVDHELAHRRRVQLMIDTGTLELTQIPDLDDRLATLEAMAERIHARGGEVIFVRFPSSKRVREIEEILYPKAIYWDKFVERTKFRTIHYSDYSELSAFDLPDGVHMDVTDQASFTRALSNLLFLPPP